MYVNKEASSQYFTLELESKYFLGETGTKGTFNLHISERKVNPSAGGYVEWVLGQSFLHNFYTVYDNTNMRIGFVEQYTAPKLQNLSSQLFNLKKASMSSAQVLVTEKLLNIMILI